MNVKWTDIITSIGAVAIPIVIFLQTSSIQKDIHNLEIETRTLNYMRVFEITTRQLLTEKRILEKKNKKICSNNVDQDCKGSFIEINSKTSAILNEYDMFCYGVNEGLYSPNVFKDLVGYVIPTVYKNYSEYIEFKRKDNIGNNELWDECEKWLEKNKASQDSSRF